MRILTILFVALLLGAPMGAGAARAGGHGPAIEAVIADQIAAFRMNDLARAFSHASPMIQTKFRTPEIFGQMVSRGYPMIWRPQRWEWSGLRETPRGPVQTVVFEDRRGNLFEADYLMQEGPDGWRIDGVSLRRLPGLAS